MGSSAAAIPGTAENRRGKQPNSQEGQTAERPPKLGGANGRTPPETRRGNSTKKQEVAPPRTRGQAKSKAGKWIEFKPGTKRKDGTRLYYPKYRRWKPGNTGKEWCGPVEELGPMTQKEKVDYVKEQRKLKARRKQRRQRRGTDKRLT